MVRVTIVFLQLSAKRKQFSTTYSCSHHQLMDEFNFIVYELVGYQSYASNALRYSLSIAQKRILLPILPLIKAIF